MEVHRRNVNGREAMMTIGLKADGEIWTSFRKHIRLDDRRQFWRAVTSPYVIEEMKDAFSAEIEAFRKAERG